jgi:hypothetical protein
VGDTKTDLIFTVVDDVSSVRILDLDVDPNNVSLKKLETKKKCRGIAVANLDNDPPDDVICALQGPTARIWLHHHACSGSHYFDLPLLISGADANVLSSDFDKDGDIEIAVASFDTGDLAVVPDLFGIVDAEFRSRCRSLAEQVIAADIQIKALDPTAAGYRFRDAGENLKGLLSPYSCSKVASFLNEEWGKFYRKESWQRNGRNPIGVTKLLDLVNRAETNFRSGISRAERVVIDCLRKELSDSSVK